MIFGYARVSTSNQANHGNSLDAQKESLIQAGAREIYIDTYTGTKTDRPQFQAMLGKMKRGDTLVVTKLDRLARSTTDGCAIVRGLLEAGVRVHVLNMGMIEDSPVGKVIMAVMFAMAEFERDMIVERTMEGKRIARQRDGYKEGRPPIEDTLGLDTIMEYMDKVRSGEMGPKQAYTELGICASTWYKLARKYK